MALEAKYGEPSLSMNGDGEQPDQELTDEQRAEKKKTVAYLKALRESSQANTKKYMGDFHEAWGYVVGEKRFPAPANQAAKQMEKRLSRTVRNGMHAMIDHRVSFITDAEPKILMKTLQPIDEVQRRELENVLASELDRLDWERDGIEAAWDAEVGSVGMTMFFVKPNQMTGESEIFSRPVDPSKVGVNRQATSFSDARYVTFEEDLSLAEIREMWPEEGAKVKPKQSKPCNAPGDTDVYQEKSDDELVTMPGNEFIVSKDGQVVDQSATVCWAWERRPETREYWEEATQNEPESGFWCPSCDTYFVDDDPTCPTCAEQGMESDGEPVDIEPGKAAKKRFIKREYPYGRCLIGIVEQEIIFFDGPNELPLERVFPFAMDVCIPMSRQFHGSSTYAMLKSNSKAQDQNISLLRDHLRYNAHPILEHPASAEIYATIGNAPGTRAPVDDELCGQARFLAGGAFDYQGFMAAEQALKSDAKEITSVDEILTGGSAGPESGEALKTRITAKSKRIGGRLKRFVKYKTDYAAIVWELMSKTYTTPRTFITKGPANELSAITMTVAELPYDVIVQVTADPDKVETDRLMGQNLSQFIMSGAIFNPQLLPLMDDILLGLGIDPVRAKAIQQKLNAVQQEAEAQASEQAQMMEAMGIPPEAMMGPNQEGPPISEEAIGAPS